MTTRTEVGLHKQLATALGWIAWLSLLLSLDRAADRSWLFAVLWLVNVLAFGLAAVLEFRDYRRLR